MNKKMKRLKTMLPGIAVGVRVIKTKQHPNGDINYEGYPGPKLVEAYEKATPQQQVFGACVGGVIIINLIWRWMWRDYY